MMFNFRPLDCIAPVLPTEMNVTFITYPKLLPTEMNLTLLITRLGSITKNQECENTCHRFFVGHVCARVTCTYKVD